VDSKFNALFTKEENIDEFIKKSNFTIKDLTDVIDHVEKKFPAKYNIVEVYS